MGKQKQIIITVAVLVLIVVVIVVCVTQLQRSDNNDVVPVPQPWKEPRLPQNVRPSIYQVDLDVYLDKGVYNGRVKINVSILDNATNVLRIHKVGYNITHTSVRSIENSSDVKIAKTFNYLPYEFWIIETDNALQPGKYEISLSFDAVLSDELNGFYKGSYKDDNDQTRRFAATFFSPISARKAFPCFDEPSFKAVFELTLTHENGYKALANMPEGSSKTLANNRVKTKFLPSLNTSTYIVAWVITDFHSLSFTDSKLNLKGWTPLNHNVTELEYGLNITAVLLPQYEKYFKIDFPLKKLDVVTLPAFAPSAMENWGLIMFRNSKFLTSKTSTYTDKKEVARIQGHELVHQWFGNLATMKFWNEAWLKEGFATFIAYIVIEDINPSMELMNTVLSDLMLKAMDIDSFSTSKPISRTVNTPNEIRQIFDSITYYKGCCMVQTLYCYMGKANFQRGMQRYLKTYSYGNANQDDLWNELSKESGGKDIKSVMDTWTKQIGHPVITTKRINATHMQVKQDRFKLDPPGIEAPKSPFNYRWKVPIIVKNINSKQQKTHLLSTEEDIFPITNDELLNPDHSLYYRVNYGEETFACLVKELNNDHLKLTELDRAGLVSDYFYLFKAKLKTLNETLKTLDYIENEQASTVWDIAAGEMGQLSALIQSKDHKDKWRKFVFTKVNKTVSSIGWETKSTYKESALQTTMLRFGCHMNISSVVQTAKRKFSEWMNGTLVLDKNLYPVMRECAISNSLNDDTFFTYTYQRYLETRDNALLTSLTTVKNPKLIQSFLQDALNKSIVKDNDASYTIGKIAKYSQQGKDMAWNLVKERWSEIFQRYGDNIFLLARLLTAVLEDFSTEQKLKDIQAFFKEKKNLGSGKNAIDQAILKIKFRIVYRDIINNDPWFR